MYHPLISGAVQIANARIYKEHEQLRHYVDEYGCMKFSEALKELLEKLEIKDA